MEFKKLTPNLSVRNVKETVTFYQEILGFTLDVIVPNEANAIEYNIQQDIEYSTAMMRKDDVFVMFIEHSHFEKVVQAFTGSTNGASVLFYIDVSDIEELYSKLKKKVTIEKELETTWYGMHEFYIKDCNGYVIGFGEKA